MTADEFLKERGIDCDSIRIMSQNGGLYKVSTLMHEYKHSFVITNKISPEEIIKAACLFFGVSEKIITGPWKNRDVCEPRYMIMLYLKLHGYNMTHIARLFHKRDHTSVGYSIRTIQTTMNESPEKEKLYKDMETHLIPYIN
jgi:chromosomal replication initiation ATPase DnaA